MSYQPPAEAFAPPSPIVTRTTQQSDRRRLGGGRAEPPPPPPARSTGIHFSADYDRDKRPTMIRIHMHNDTDDTVTVLRRVGDRRAEIELEPRTRAWRDHKFGAANDDIICTVGGQIAFRSTVGDVIRSAPPEVKLLNVAVDGRRLDPDLWSRPGEEHRFRVPLGPTVRLATVDVLGDGASARIVDAVLGEVSVNVGNSDVAVYTTVESIVPVHDVQVATVY